MPPSVSDTDVYTDGKNIANSHTKNETICGPCRENGPYSTLARFNVRHLR
jgi:hypothetical protein